MTDARVKVAIVSAASGGSGRAVALRLARDGFAVVLNYAGDAGKAEEAVAEIKSFPGYRVLANELRGREITVNAVALGPVSTAGFLRSSASAGLKTLPTWSRSWPALLAVGGARRGSGPMEAIREPSGGGSPPAASS